MLNICCTHDVLHIGWHVNAPLCHFLTFFFHSFKLEIHGPHDSSLRSDLVRDFQYFVSRGLTGFGPLIPDFGRYITSQLFQLSSDQISLQLIELVYSDSSGEFLLPTFVLRYEVTPVSP